MTGSCLQETCMPFTSSFIFDLLVVDSYVIVKIFFMPLYVYMCMIEKLQNFNIQLPIVVMSDFIIDRIIKLNSKQDLFNMINNKSKFGAGAIRGIQTYENKGGKAVNVAYCLAKLGAKQVTLFTIADKLGLAILEHVFSDFRDTVNLQIKKGKDIVLHLNF